MVCSVHQSLFRTIHVIVRLHPVHQSSTEPVTVSLHVVHQSLQNLRMSFYSQYIKAYRTCACLFTASTSKPTEPVNVFLQPVHQSRQNLWLFIYIQYIKAYRTCDRLFTSRILSLQLYSPTSKSILYRTSDVLFHIQYIKAYRTWLFVYTQYIKAHRTCYCLFTPSTSKPTEPVTVRLQLVHQSLYIYRTEPVIVCLHPVHQSLQNLWRSVYS